VPRGKVAAQPLLLTVNQPGLKRIFWLPWSDTPHLSLARKWENATIAGAGKICVVTPTPGLMTNYQGQINAWAVSNQRKVTMYLSNAESLRKRKRANHHGSVSGRRHPLESCCKNLMQNIYPACKYPWKPFPKTPIFCINPGCLVKARFLQATYQRLLVDAEKSRTCRGDNKDFLIHIFSLK